MEREYPYKLEFGVWYPNPKLPEGGKSLPIWVYDSVPEGMVRVSSIRELWWWRPFLFASQLFPGEYMTGYMRESVVDAVKYMLTNDIPIYVKDNNNKQL